MPSVDVRSCGADDTGATSVWSAVRMAIGRAGRGGEVFLPAGSYLGDAGLTYLPGQTIRGAGPELTTLKCGPGFMAALIELGSVGQTVRDLTLDLSAGNADGNFGIRLNSAVGPRLENVRIIGNAGTRGINPVGSVTDVEVCGYWAESVQWGLLTADDAVVDGLRFLDFRIDGAGMVGDGIEINVPAGSWRDVEIGSGTVRNFANRGNDGMGVGVSGSGEGLNIHDLIVRNVGLDGIHVETAPGGILRDVNLHDISVADAVRSGVSLQSMAGGLIEAARVHDNTATRCNTGVTSTAGAFEASGATGIIRGVSLRGNTAMDCGNPAADSVSVLLGSVTTSSCADWTASIRQSGTRANRAVLNGGRGNTTSRTITY